MFLVFERFILPNKDLLVFINQEGLLGIKPFKPRLCHDRCCRFLTPHRRYMSFYPFHCMPCVSRSRRAYIFGYCKTLFPYTIHRFRCNRFRRPLPERSLPSLYNTGSRSLTLCRRGKSVQHLHDYGFFYHHLNRQKAGV